MGPSFTNKRHLIFCALLCACVSLNVQIADAEGNVTSHPVTVDEVHVLKKGQYGIMLGRVG